MCAVNALTQSFLNYFNTNGQNVLYAEFSQAAASDGFLVSYDGIMVEF